MAFELSRMLRPVAACQLCGLALAVRFFSTRVFFSRLRQFDTRACASIGFTTLARARRACGKRNNQPKRTFMKMWVSNVFTRSYVHRRLRDKSFHDRVTAFSTALELLICFRGHIAWSLSLALFCSIEGVEDLLAICLRLTLQSQPATPHPPFAHHPHPPFAHHRPSWVTVARHECRSERVLETIAAAQAKKREKKKNAAKEPVLEPAKGVKVVGVSEQAVNGTVNGTVNGSGSKDSLAAKRAGDGAGKEKAGRVNVKRSQVLANQVRCVRSG